MIMKDARLRRRSDHFVLSACTESTSVRERFQRLSRTAETGCQERPEYIYCFPLTSASELTLFARESGRCEATRLDRFQIDHSYQR